MIFTSYIRGLWIILLFIAMGFTPAYAADVNTTACVSETYQLLAKEQRMERSVLFGQRSAKDSPIGSVRYDASGNAWMKKGTNAWNSLEKNLANTTWSDGLMDSKADIKVRRGLLEMQQASTSDLIPAITHSFRAYQCRLRAVCALASKSQESDVIGQSTTTVQPDGCIAFTLPVLRSCKDNQQLTSANAGCEKVVEQLLDHESNMLVLLVSYDAAYRSLLQFQGVFEGFLSTFRFTLLEPLWQTVRVIGGFNHIPCFLSQCNE